MAARVVVTGGGGFLGRFVARALRDAGREVVALGRNRYPFLEREGIATAVCDLTDAAATRAALAGAEEVHHCAALAGISVRLAPFVRANLDATRHVVDACRAHGVARLVFTSSPSVVYGGGDEEAVDESAPYPARHLAHYPATKAAAERLALAADTPGGLRVCALRPHLIFGPEDTNLVPRLVARARAGRLVRVGPGRNRADVTYVENVARAHLRAAESLARGGAACGRAYFITNGEPVAVWPFIDRILAGVGLPPVRRALPAPVAYGLGACLEAAYALAGATGEPPMTRFLARQLSTTHTYSIAAARRDLGYEPRVSVEEGIARTCAWFRENGPATA